MPHPASRVHFRIRAYIRPARGRDPASQPKTCNLHLLSICGLPGITRPKHTRVVGNLGGYLQSRTNFSKHPYSSESGRDGGREGGLFRVRGRNRRRRTRGEEEEEGKESADGRRSRNVSIVIVWGGEEVTSGEFLHTGHGGERLVPANLNRGAGYMRM